ncbi:VanW family protein [Paenactinomyces guangxiensis]|uniref:VanW family protein n=1 Tax=Paenactinomyces guangxiensis TaxID=1490290 RepID=A0A7W1WSY0_9BACL|nr:VanW family protein [Paenactinomyces guangxiensis]MBA4495465.1 VanW family protein [Paenactinomyces guangxiensis]MBH8592412.1 VanW family protein [Paenactinomyces guangxiensis]
MEEKKLPAGGQSPEEHEQSRELREERKLSEEKESVVESKYSQKEEQAAENKEKDMAADVENSESASSPADEQIVNNMKFKADDRVFNTTEFKALDQWYTDGEQKPDVVSKEQTEANKETQEESVPKAPAAKELLTPVDEGSSQPVQSIELKKAENSPGTPKVKGKPDPDALALKRKKIVVSAIVASMIMAGSLGAAAYAFDAFNAKANAKVAAAQQKPKPAMFQLYLEDKKFDLDLRTIGYNGKDTSTIDEQKLRAWLEKVNKEVYQPAQNARMKKVGYKITPEKQGRKMDVETVESWLTDIKPLINKPREIPMIPIEPLVTTEDLRNVDKKLIGDYRTRFDGSNVNRTTNIRLASKEINGLVLMPGEKFSFNKTVGERTAARGYKKAGVIVKGEFSEGIGGGICQVSSTLFNSVDEAGLRIVARYHHSAEVTYVPPGRDATVSWGGPDFKFRNNLNKPVMIKIKVGSNSITVYTYTVPGAKVHKKKVQDAPETFTTIKVDPDKPTEKLPKTDTNN